MKVEIKNYRSCRGNEGDAYSCSLYLDGKRAAMVQYDGSGGSLFFDWTPSSKKNMHGGPLHDAFKAYVETLPPIDADRHGGPIDTNMDIVVDDAIYEMLLVRELKRLCKKNKATVYRISTDKPDTWRIIDRPFGVLGKCKLLKQAAQDNIEVDFANERAGFRPTGEQAFLALIRENHGVETVEDFAKIGAPIPSFDDRAVRA